MSKKVKTYGPSNDAIPQDELELAMLIQNAKSRGFHSTQGALREGRGVCAVGAWQLNKSRFSGKFPPPGIVEGNDSLDDEGCNRSLVYGWNIGAAYEVALRPKR